MRWTKADAMEMLAIRASVKTSVDEPAAEGDEAAPLSKKGRTIL